MDNQQHLQKKKRKLKFLFIAPLIILLLATLIFWGLGGGQSDHTKESNNKSAGLNTNLPNPQLKNDKWDKLKFYEQAQRDSAKLKTLMKLDPFYRNSLVLSDSLKMAAGPIEHSRISGASNISLRHKPESYEEKVYEKIAAINEQINQDTIRDIRPPKQPTKQVAAVSEGSIDRLEKMMNLIQDDGQDEEMQQINNMLDKLGAIQQPQAFRQWKQESEKQPEMVFAVNIPSSDNISLLHSDLPIGDTGITRYRKGAVSVQSHNQFYSMDDNVEMPYKQTTVQAVIYGTQIIADKTDVRLRTLQDILVNGILIPEGHELHGIASLNNSRLLITIKQVVYKQSILPISLSVYTLEGLEGLPILGNNATELARQSADLAMQTVGMPSVGGSLGAEAISSTIQTAKSLIGRRMRPAKVTVPSGYKVLLYSSRFNSY